MPRFKVKEPNFAQTLKQSKKFKEPNFVDLRTSKTVEEIVTDVAGSFGAAVTVVDTDESPEVTRLDLALILEDLIGLNHGHGEFSAAVLAEIAEPEQPVFPFAAAAAARSGL